MKQAINIKNSIFVLIFLLTTGLYSQNKPFAYNEKINISISRADNYEYKVFQSASFQQLKLKKEILRYNLRNGDFNNLTITKGSVISQPPVLPVIKPDTDKFVKISLKLVKIIL